MTERSTPIPGAADGAPSQARNPSHADNPFTDDVKKLNPFTDAKELLLRALEKAGYPPENIAALRRYGDPRPRIRFLDGTTVVVEYVPLLPPERKVWEAFQLLCAEAVGYPIDPRRPREEFFHKLANLRLELPDAVMACDYRDKEAAERIYSAVADPPDPADERAWNAWARTAWQEFRCALARPLTRHVLGENARQDEGEVRGVQADPDMLRPGLTHGSDTTAGSLHDVEVRIWEEQILALAGLSEGEDEVWRLDVAGYNRQEIADIRDCAVGTVDSLLHRARKKLREAAS